MRRIAVLTLMLLFATAALGEVDEEAVREAQRAAIPEGLSEREAEIYRSAYAEGYYAALHPEDGVEKYILNTSSHKFHKNTCSVAASIADNNREVYEGPRADVVRMGYSPCGMCNP